MPNYIFDKAGSIYDVPDTLSKRKSISLAGKLAEKKERLAPSPVHVASVGLAPSDTGSGYGEAALSSLALAGGSLADFGRNVSNTLLGTEFDDRAETGWSSQEAADIAAGVDPEYRRRVQEGQHAVLENIADEEYWEAVKSAADVAVPTAIGSVSSLVEMGIGALGTSLGGAGAPLLAKKVADVAKGTSNIFDAYTDIKKARATKAVIKKAEKARTGLQKVAGIPAAAAKAARQMSLVTADLSQRQVAAYREEYGEEPSLGRKAAITLGVMATTIADPAIVKNLFIPDFRKTLGKELKNATKNLGASDLLSVGKRVAAEANNIVKAGGVELVQEYLQTWQEALTVNISPEEADNLMKAIGTKLQDKGLRDQALAGGFLGAGAGGVTRGAISAPSLVTGTAVDVTKAAVKTTAKVAKGTVDVAAKTVQAASTATGLKLLNQSDRDAISNNYQAEQAVVDEESTVIDGKIASVEKAETLADIQADEGALVALRRAQEDLGLSDDALADPVKLNKIKKKMIAKFNADKQLLQTTLDASALGAAAKQIAKNVKHGVTKVVKATSDLVTEEMVEKTIAAAVKTKEGVETAIDAVKGLESSTARGLVDMALKEGVAKWPEIKKAATEISMGDLARAASAIGVKDPKIGKRLRVMYKRRRKLLKGTGQVSDELFTEENIPGGISAAADTGTLEGQSHRDLSAAIRSVMAGKIADKATLAQVKKALAVYKASDAYTYTGTKGRIDETNMIVFEKTIANAEKRLARAPTKENVEAAVETVKETVKDTTKTVKEKTAEPIKKATAVVKKAAGKLSKLVDGRKVIGEGNFKKALVAIEKKVLKDNEFALGVAEDVTDLVAGLTKAGYTTAKDFADFLQEFPGYTKNKELLTALEESFEESMVVMQKDISEDVNEKTSPTENNATIIESTKKLLGC